MHLLLDSFNKNHIFNYDENGFLMQSDNKNKDSLIEFNLYYDEEGIEKISSSSIFLSFQHIKKIDNVYSYNISIIEETPTADFHAFGIVEIHYNDGNINKIIVNHKENGYLHDKYNDCFDIKPDHYMHLIYSKYKVNE